MKKLFSSLLTLAVVAVMAVLTSCGGGAPDVTSIVDKYNNGEELTDADYSALLDYTNAALDEALPLAKEAMAAMEDGDMEKVASLEEESKAIEAKYEHMEIVGQIIAGAQSGFSEENMEKAAEIAKKSMEAIQ